MDHFADDLAEKLAPIQPASRAFWLFYGACLVALTVAVIA
jgi:hypothetical protein